MARGANSSGLLRQGAGCARSARNQSGALLFIGHKPAARSRSEGTPMHGIIYLIGLIVVILAILSFFGLR